MKRLVYRTNKEPITDFNPSYKKQWTNQVFEDGKWKFVNRYIGKFGARPIVWYATKEWAESCSPQDNNIADPIEWDDIDDEGYKNVCAPSQYESIKRKGNKEIIKGKI